MKTKENRGISLIVLVITIIVIIILATAIIVTILDNNPINSAIKAVDDSNISKYTEQIELVRAKLQLQSEEHVLPTIYQMQEVLEKEKWVVETEIIMDEGIEKLKLVTKEGYIFYITGETVEYKGKGKVVDTSALEKEDAIKLIAEEKTTKGQNVKITSDVEEYYTIKYKIGEEGEWIKIENGKVVEVPFGEIIYAKLFYGNNEGIESKLVIGHTNPSLVAKDLNTSNMKRKTDNSFANLFDITWGSQGTGTVKYEVTGNMLFNNKSYTNTSITNTKDLELGTYNVKCTITSPSGYTTSQTKQVKINQLANTSVTNSSGSNVNANAIYNEYDLAYFRDLVNSSGRTNNAKVMNNINMSNVNLTSWNPIGNVNSYEGIFEGNNKTISNLSINTTLDSQGLFGKSTSSRIQNLTLSGNVKSDKYYIAMLVGYCEKNVVIDNCKISSGSVSGGNRVGGISGATGDVSVEILNCKSNISINGTFRVGGIVGHSRGIIKYCLNTGKITATYDGDGHSFVGGIAGESGLHGITNTNYIYSCANKADITGYTYVGGIVGENRKGAYIDYCYSIANASAITQTNQGWVACGGIVGETYGNVSHSFAKGTVRGNGNYVGGVIGIANSAITVKCVEGLANVYRYNEHVGTVAWDKNLSGGLYGTINNISYQSHSYVNGKYTTGLSWWYTPEFDRIDSTAGVPKLNWED